MRKVLYLTETGRGIESWREMFATIDSSFSILLPEEVTDFNDIEFVLAWKPPKGIFPKLTNLKLIQSLGMGVDHLLACPDIPKTVAVARIVDADMTIQMQEYVLWGALTAYRNLQRYRILQTQSKWSPQRRHFHDTFKIGIMGLGELGHAVAEHLQLNGFKNIRGWARTPKSFDGIESFAGETQLNDFAKTLDLLVCLLPLTTQTKGILNQSLFRQLQPGAYLINPARGEHLVEADLLTALDNEQLSGALLDVFQTEPLPSDHPFWQHPKITITPHIAAATNPRTAAEQVIENFKRVTEGLAPNNLVNIDREY